VHPGPAASGAGTASPWWPALAAYPASLHLAWWAWLGAGAANHPRLRVVFAALAGLAPLHAERAAVRGAPVTAPPTVFYDTSSYGPQAIAAMRRAVGVEQLVHGSDLPVLEGVAAPADEALLQTNPASCWRERPAPLRRAELRAVVDARMGAYRIASGGRLERHPLAKDEELKPLAVS